MATCDLVGSRIRQSDYIVTYKPNDHMDCALDALNANVSEEAAVGDVDYNSSLQNGEDSYGSGQAEDVRTGRSPTSRAQIDRHVISTTSFRTPGCPEAASRNALQHQRYPHQNALCPDWKTQSG